MSLIELLVAILYVFIGIKTAIIISDEFNIFVGFLSFFMTVYISYYLLFVLISEIVDYFNKCRRKITKLGENKISKQDKIFWWNSLIGILIGIIISYLTIPLLGYLTFIISLILGYLVHLIYLYICYNLNICKRKK